MSWVTRRRDVKLRVYTAKEYLKGDERYVATLYPFWGLYPDPPGDNDEGRFDEYARVGSDFFELVNDIDASDIVLLPFEWKPNSPEHVRAAHGLSQEAARHGKRVIIFFNNDSAEDIPIENAIIFRTSFYRSTRRANEFAIPGWSVDFLSRYLGGQLPVRKKMEVPVVGYCGYVDYDYFTPMTLVKHALRIACGKDIKAGFPIRGAAVRTLRRDSRVMTNFICRSDFMGAAGSSARYEYARNIAESDYALVTRGTGNFSYRLYEVMSCGKIPVFVDTDCVLPFDHLIDWKRCCVWVDVKELDSLGDRIIDFHEKISSVEFEALQRAVRCLYEEWLSPVGFHKNLWRCIFGS